MTKMLFPLFCAALLPALPTQFACAQGNASLVVKTVNGLVQGTLEKSGVTSFKGVPFAAPPVGSLRWREPQPAVSWTGIRKADHFGPRAMQPPIFADMVFRSDGMSEDCLYLNVWVPPHSGEALLPVLVYFYGGGYVAGDGSEGRYDGESLATKGIVTLTVNYRLGIFGFFAHPELTQESPNHASGDYGLLDQAAALRWVQANIGAFGGDPKRVTIAGESAGSVSVSALMASPLSRDLIAGAIGESGSVLGTLPARPLSVVEQAGTDFMHHVGANSLSDLRAMSAQQLMDSATRYGPFRFSLAIDGYFLPKSPYAIFEVGEEAHVPLLAGWNSMEQAASGIMGAAPHTLDNYITAVRKTYGASADSVLHYYSATSDGPEVQGPGSVERVARALASDRFTGFSTWKWTEAQAQTGGKPVYRYYFERPRPGTNAPGAGHSWEIEYALGDLGYNKVYPWTADDYKVSATMEAYFANFIKTGDPNGPGLPNWPAINAGGTMEVMHINVTSGAQPETREARYEFLDRLRQQH